jgi:mono/diheme cytochrome c family protein
MTLQTTTILLLLLTACGGGGDSSGPYARFTPGPTPPELRRGEVVFNTFCMSCHGRYARGEGLGPSMLDSLFLPGRLSDEAFVRAVGQGVPQSNYHFGAMPPVKPVGPADIPEITRYVRWLQQRARETGVISGAAGSPP